MSSTATTGSLPATDSHTQLVDRRSSRDGSSEDLLKEISRLSEENSSLREQLASGTRRYALPLLYSSV